MGLGTRLVKNLGDQASASTWRKSAKTYHLLCNQTVLEVYGALERNQNEGGASRAAVINDCMQKVQHALNETDRYCERVRSWANTMRSNALVDVTNDLVNLYNNMGNFQNLVSRDDMASMKSWYFNAKAKVDELQQKGVKLTEEGGETKQMGWGVCILLLFLLPPVGLVLCIMKMFKKK